MKTLIVSWHGLGDHIIVTPALRKYAEETGEELYLAHIERLPVDDLFAKCPYIKGFHKTSDAWNDYDDIDLGRHHVLLEAKEYADKFNYDKIIELTIAPSLGILHKVHRAAHELGITVTDYQTEMFPKITKHTKKKATQFLKGMEPPFTFIHMDAGNPPKNVPADVAMGILGPYNPKSVIEYGSNHIPAKHLPIGDIALEMEILSRCDRVICADSFIMHAAGTLGIPTQAVFLITPPYWVIPLHDTPLEIFIRV